MARVCFIWDLDIKVGLSSFHSGFNLVFPREPSKRLYSIHTEVFTSRFSTFAGNPSGNASFNLSLVICFVVYPISSGFVVVDWEVNISCLYIWFILWDTTVSKFGHFRSLHDASVDSAV